MPLTGLELLESIAVAFLFAFAVEPIIQNKDQLKNLIKKVKP